MEKWISINRVIQFGTSLIAVVLLAAIRMMPAASFPSLVAQSNIYWQKAEAKRLYEQGINQSGRGDIKEALQSWQLALAIYQQIQDRAGEEKALKHLGTTYMKLQTSEQLTEAIDYFQQELAIAREIKDRSFEERVRYWLEAVDRRIQDRQKAEAERLYEQGINKSRRGDSKEALRFWQLALAIYQQIQDRAGKEKALEHLGTTLDNLGTTSMKLQTPEQLTEAIDYFQQQLVIARKIKDRSFEERARYWLETVDRIQKSAMYERERKAYLRAYQGDEYYRTGQFGAALQSWQQDLILYRKSGNPYKEASTLSKLSDAYRSLGNYAKAIEYGQQSLAIVQKHSNDSLTQLLINSLDLIKDEVLTNLGDDYFALGNYAKAIDYYQQGLVIARELSDPLGTWSLLNKVGHVYYALGDYIKAIDYQRQSLAAWQTIHGSVREQGRGRALADIGSVYYAKGDYAKAIEYQQQSLAIARTVKDRQGEGQSLGNLGLVYLSRRDYVKAIDYLQQSLAIMQEIKDRPGEGISLSNLGNVFAAQKQSDLAIIFYKQSVNVREGIRQDIRILSRELQESYTQTVAGSYRRLADLLLSQGRVLEAQQVLELLKIQELRDYTRDTRAGGETQGSPLTPVESRVVPPYNNLVNLGLKLTECELKPPYCPERDQLRALRDQANAEFNKQADKLRALAKQQRQRDPAQIQQEELTVAAQKIVQSQPKTVLIYPLVLADFSRDVEKRIGSRLFIANQFPELKMSECTDVRCC